MTKLSCQNLFLNKPAGYNLATLSNSDSGMGASSRFYEKFSKASKQLFDRTPASNCF